MNNTEERLRDYLDTKAGSIPANEQGPGLLAETTRRRPLWPALGAAAAVVAVLAVTATLLTNADDKPTPAATPAAHAAPKLPYIFTEVEVVKDSRYGDVLGDETSTLYDGAQKVRIPKNVTIRARVDGGWLGESFTDKGLRVVILRPDGTTRFLGPDLSSAPTLSPDRRQVAMVVDKFRGDEQGRVAIIDLASGSEVGSIPLPRKVSVLGGWSSRGIFTFSDISGKYELFAAQPGDKQFQLVSMPGFVGGTIATTGDVVAAGAGGNGCLEAGVFRGTNFDVLRKYCERGKMGSQPMLSTDGRTMIYLSGNLAVDIASGRTTKLDLPDPMETLPPGAFEDATHALVTTMGKQARGFGPVRMYRCDVTTGKCTLLRTEKYPNQLSIVRG
ncbi:hypothetical protein ACFVWG_23005 [Kribbella sp. NPDC058245]|uniref:hypothetical protein n=1 Tax=Kribbella sp. NPDC058245 TaxID=3346399 RepID=UPI0036EDBF08